MIDVRAATAPGWADPVVLTDEVLPRRVFAYGIDLALIMVIAASLWVCGFIFGLITLGLGFPVLRLLPFVPLAYHFLSLISPLSATPGQRLMDLVVRRDADLGPPTATEAVISVAAFYGTLALGVIWLGVALFTRRGRAPHDLLSGLVVVRLGALTAASSGWKNRFGGRSNA